jgi:hypothetical protein
VPAGQSGQPGYGTPYGYPGGPPPQPPKSNRTAIIAAVVGVLVVAGGIVAAVALTGGDNKPQAGGGGSSSVVSQSPSVPGLSSTGSFPSQTASAPSFPASVSASVPSNPGTGATAAGDQYFAAVGNGDLAGLKRLACPGTTITLTQAELDQVTAATPDGPATETGDAATQTGKLDASDGSSATVTVFLSKKNGSWCLDHTTAS